jgi:hypothetical protein
LSPVAVSVLLKGNAVRLVCLAGCWEEKVVVVEVRASLAARG